MNEIYDVLWNIAMFLQIKLELLQTVAFALSQINDRIVDTVITSDLVEVTPACPRCVWFLLFLACYV